MNKEDYEKLLEFRKKAKLFRGEQLLKMGRWPQKEHFELCPKMWFWAYNPENSVYPNMMICSGTPFWTEGQAKTNLSISIESLSKRIEEFE